jgi:pSer/pThr/pTyr-binding forkhead associated (FHA) protein
VECDVVVKDTKASRKHCRLTRKANGFVLEDLGSSNGTYYNGQKITAPVELGHNQSFKIGDTIFYLA